VLAGIIGFLSIALAWGAWGHQHINRAAVFALPEPVRRFFYNHIDFITEEAVVPDLRKYTINDRAEFPRHLNKAGMVPWYIQEVMEKLTKAFRSKRKTEILFLAADLGHYIGDAHMPLHTALNHDGQLTGQKGIHALWEGQLPEMFGGGYNLCTGPARFIGDIARETWQMIDSTHRLAEGLLAIDREMTASLPREKVYLLDSAGKIVVNAFGDLVHTREYASEYHKRLQGMVERQLRGAIAETSSYWFTAWVNAGRPDLFDLDPQELTDRNKQHLSDDLRRWEQGRVGMFRPDGEFTKFTK